MMQSPERINDKNLKGLDESAKKHIARYEYAASKINSGKCADVACGVGYGSQFLSEVAQVYHGYDRDIGAIQSAIKNYTTDNTVFFHRDIREFRPVENEYSSIVSLETLEHIEFDLCCLFLARCAAALKTTGDVFVGSSPMLRYKDGLPYVTNPWHVNELPRQQLISLIEFIFEGFDIDYKHQQVEISELTDQIDGFLLFTATRR